MLATFLEFLTVSAAITGCAPADPQPPVAVEIRRGGDDGLTVRFADALETGVRGSRIFRASGPGRPARLVFEIPRSLGWTEIGSRVQVHFQVDFKSGDSRVLGTSRGTCWETNLNVCVARVLNDAPRASGPSSR